MVYLHKIDNIYLKRHEKRGSCVFFQKLIELSYFREVSFPDKPKLLNEL